MAQRKRPDTAPKLDGAVKDYGFSSDALTEHGFGTFVRMVKLGRVSQLAQIKYAVDEAMTRLRLHVKNTEPVEGIPDGSDQVNVGTFVSWCAKVRKRDAEAKSQLVKIAATIKARLG